MLDIALHRFAPQAVRLTLETRRRQRADAELAKRRETLVHVLTGSGRSIIFLIALFTILPILGISIAPLLASIGIVGIALGFGAQTLVRDIIRGISIVVDNQFSRGDMIRVAGITGVVEDVGLRRTIVRDLDGVLHYIPNAEITVASNFTQEDSRINFNVTVSYTEDVDRVIEVIDGVGKELAEDPQWRSVLREPPRADRVEAISDSGIEIKIVGETDPMRHWDVSGELRKRLLRVFAREGIKIPLSSPSQGQPPSP